jgi:hypothetical protein
MGVAPLSKERGNSLWGEATPLEMAEDRFSEPIFFWLLRKNLNKQYFKTIFLFLEPNLNKQNSG